MILNRYVDLVDLRAASTVMQMQVLLTEECLFCGDVQARDLFEMIVYASYARLNEERAGILEDIRTRGSVYGEDLPFNPYFCIKVFVSALTEPHLYA